MGNWYWFCGDDGIFDLRNELRRCRTRNRYNAALIVNRLTDALELGAAAVENDKIIGSPFWFFQSGNEGVFYIVESLTIGADVKVVWVGSMRPTSYSEALREAERRLANL